MSCTVMIKGAKWRRKEIDNVVLPVVREFRQTQTDGYGTITVDATSLGYGIIRLGVHARQIAIDGELPTMPIKVEEERSEVAEELRQSMELPLVPLQGDFNGETEEAAISRISERFLILNEMTEAISNGYVKSMIISGPPGVGKSYGVEEVLRCASVFDIVGQQKLKYEFVKGSVSPIGLYKKLHEFSDKHQVLVFDDADDVLLDPISLSLLKAALDTTTKRYLSWNKESYLLQREGVPDRFEFRAGIIFITNLDFTAVRSKILRPHLDAMMSRAHYINLDIHTMRDKFLRIKAVVKETDMLSDYCFCNGEQDIIMKYLADNVSKFQEVSLRTVLKLADLVKMKQGEGWEKIARVTLMKKH